MTRAREIAEKMGRAYLDGLHTERDSPTWELERIEILSRSVEEIEAFIMGLNARSSKPKFKMPKKLR